MAVIQQPTKLIHIESVYKGMIKKAYTNPGMYKLLNKKVNTCLKITNPSDFSWKTNERKYVVAVGWSGNFDIFKAETFRYYNKLLSSRQEVSKIRHAGYFKSSIFSRISG